MYSMANFELSYFVTDSDLSLSYTGAEEFMPSAHIASVANAIWRLHPRLHNRDVSSDLALYTPKRSISLLSAEDFKNGISEILDQGKRPRLEALNGPLLPRQKVSDLWPFGPDENVLQLIVVPAHQSAKRNVDHESAELALSKRRRVEDEAGPPDPVAIWRTRDPPSDLPEVHDLRAFLLEPLKEREKFPVTRLMFNGMLSSSRVDPCTEKDLECIFTINNLEAPSSTVPFMNAVQMPSSAMGPKSTYINFWDCNIRSLLEVLILGVTSRRDTCWLTETGKCRPDVILTIGDKCPFRGEEKSPQNSDNPKAELVDKLVGWKYDPAPYVLGYYAIGSLVTYVAIMKTNARVHAVDLIRKDLKLMKNRVENIGIILHLALLIKALPDYMGPESIDEYKSISRPNCTIELSQDKIFKNYTCEDGIDRVRHLKDIYAILVSKDVPHIDRLMKARYTSVILTPRGIEKQPNNDRELLDATISVLETLKVAHEEPNPVFHRDIRWNNVLREIQNPTRWFLIDWEDSSVAPTKAAPHFNSMNHSPGVFADNHGAEVDIWGVGFLISSCASSGISSELRVLGREICNSSHKYSPERLLQRIREIRAGPTYTLAPSQEPVAL